jgi:hypothetical protein
VQDARTEFQGTANANLVDALDAAVNKINQARHHIEGAKERDVDLVDLDDLKAAMDNLEKAGQQAEKALGECLETPRR